jgi:hypothetical protein
LNMLTPISRSALLSGISGSWTMRLGGLSTLTYYYLHSVIFYLIYLDLQ